MKYILWYILAKLLTIIFNIIGFLYTILKSVCTFDKSYLINYCKAVAYSLDQYWNASLSEPLNDFLLIRRKWELFGNEDEKISSVMGKQKKRNNLTKLGRKIDHILDKFFGSNHSTDAIDETIKQ